MVGDAHDAEAAIALAHVRQVHEECAVVGVDAAIRRVRVDARRLQLRCAKWDQSRGELRRGQHGGRPSSTTVGGIM